MVCSGRWRLSCKAHLRPAKSVSVELVKVIQIVTTVSASEHVNGALVPISGVHVARARRVASRLIREPLKGVQVKHVQVVCSQWALPEPAANYEQSIL